jgi:hypothetical protein
LLPNGKVLVAGGLGSIAVLASAELYDPANGTWTPTGNLTTARSSHTATLLPGGRVLIAAGEDNGFDASASCELYDPASGLWMSTGSLTIPRSRQTATLLTDGRVLVAGGRDSDANPSASAELHDVGLGFTSAWKPKIRNATFTPGQRLRLTGSLFQGISQGSGGNYQDSSTNYPIVQLRSIDNSQIAFLQVDPIKGWSDTNFTSLPVQDFPFGPALVTIFTNGIPSTTKYLVLTER